MFLITTIVKDNIYAVLYKHNSVFFSFQLFLFPILLFRLMVKFMFTGKELLNLSWHHAEATSMRMVMWHQ